MPTYRELVETYLRDFEGYAGDGRGGRGTLPVGDRTTARRPIFNRDLRELFLAWDGGANVPEFRIEDFRDVAALLANTTLAYGPGSAQAQAGNVIRTRAEGFSYQVAASGATDHHLITSGGVKLYVLRNAYGASVKARGAFGGGTLGEIAAIQATLNAAAVPYNAADWQSRFEQVHVGIGNRVALGSYQASYEGIIDFNELSWPVNATVHFNGGSGEHTQHSNNIAHTGTPVNEWRYEAPYHPAIILNQRTPASYAEVQPAHSLGNTDTREFASIVFQQDTVGQFQLFADLGTNTLQVKAFPPVAGGFLSKVWQIDGESGRMGVQARNIDTTDGAALTVGGALKVINGTGAINGHESDPEPRVYFQDPTTGHRAYVALDSISNAINVKSITQTAEGAAAFKIDENTFFYKSTYAGLPATAAGMKIGKNSTTNVSIIASGAIQINSVSWKSGAGSPEGVVQAVPGSFYSRTDGGAGTSFYVKESGTGNTGWVAK